MKAVMVIMVLTVATSAQAADKTWVLTETGLGPVHIGMTAAQVARVLHKPVKLDSDDDARVCAEVMLPGLSGTSAIFLNEKLDSLWVRGAAPYATKRGIRPGATDAKVRAVYPEAKVSAADYDEAPAANLLYWARKDKAGIEFRTGTDRKVISIAAGGPSIQYMEGCS